MVYVEGNCRVRDTFVTHIIIEFVTHKQVCRLRGAKSLTSTPLNGLRGRKLVSTCVYMDTYIPIYICIYIHTSAYIYMCIWKSLTFTRLNGLRGRKLVSLCVCGLTYTYMYMYILYIYVYMYIHD